MKAHLVFSAVRTMRWGTRSAALLALFAALSPSACSSDEPTVHHGSGGARGTGAHPSATDTDASVEGGVATGSGGQDGGTGDASAFVPGTLGSIWKRASTYITGYDTDTPGNPLNDSVTLPSTITSPEFDGRTVDLYEEIDGSALVTYCHLEGDSVYYRVTVPLTNSGDVFVTMTGDLSRLYQLKDGQLVEQFSYNIGPSIFLNQTTFTAYQGTFPPPSWPSKVVSLE